MTPQPARETHPNAELVRRLYGCLDRHQPEEMAKCYHPDATFHDIAFDLSGKERIAAMWRMICAGDIRAALESVQAGDATGSATVVDQYTFTDTGRPVRNRIQSEFRFRDGLIVEHRDSCDARAWASAAIGGAAGFLAGRFRFLRAWKAGRKLRRFVRAGGAGLR